MANIAEVNQWDVNVHELATTDPVEGGPGGISNAQAQALANRTLYLKTLIEQVLAPFIGAGGGGMVLWKKAANLIPPGWAEVVDWRGRMPVGWDPTDTDFNTVGNPGGSKTKSIGLSNLPDHHHKMYVNNNGGQNSGSYVESNRYVAAEGADGGPSSYKMAKPTNFDLPTLGMTERVGGNQVLNVLNPYRIVVFIEWVGP